MARKSTDTLIATQGEAARLLGIATRTLRLWEAEEWFPKDGRTPAGWNVDKIKSARDANDRKGSPGSGDKEDRKRQRDETDLAIKKQILAQETMKRQNLEGSLFPRAAVELVHSTILTQIGDVFDELPDLIGRLAAPSERKAVETELRRRGNAFREALEKQLTVALKEWDDLNK